MPPWIYIEAHLYDDGILRSTILVRRKQGMRVGMAFSAVLDPYKDPLFSELGNFDLTPAEAWHASCIRTSPGAKETSSQDSSKP